ncbi:VOC family protein [uncultured Phenylobacterium sp.]|uniref:VOC family protein n=1 Tax=uncultured Phenylobacterium sp. TaxID=349273 RepID=UPI0025F132AE|nr:VOC family protein [uncultured Phenylobacterium sp.]
MIKGLHHIAVVVRDFDAAAQGYQRLLDVASTAQDGGGARRAWFWLDNIGLELISPDGDGPSGDRVRARLEAAGEGQWLVAFTASDLGADSRLLERRGLAVSERTERATMFEPASTGGVQLALMGFPRLVSQAKGPLVGLDHVVVNTANPDRALAVYGAKLGLELRLDRNNEQWGARQMFFRAGDDLVEIGASLKAPVTDAPDSFGGLAWLASDPAAVHARLAASGFNVSEMRKGRKPGTQVFTVRDAPGGVPTIVIQQTAPEPA